jgi:hypothetical protein
MPRRLRILLDRDRLFMPGAELHECPPIRTFSTKFFAKGDGMKRIAWIILGWLTLITTTQAAQLSPNQIPFFIKPQWFFPIFSIMWFCDYLCRSAFANIPG